LFFIPVIEPLQKLKFAYGPALNRGWGMMIGAIRKIEFDDLTGVGTGVCDDHDDVSRSISATALTAGLLVYPLLNWPRAGIES